MYAATYDVQTLSVEGDKDIGKVKVIGEFVSGSRAAGCLLIFQGRPTSPDIFKALLRTDSEDKVSTTISVPSLTTVYGYDLEENLLPDTLPAVVIKKEISVRSG